MYIRLHLSFYHTMNAISLHVTNRRHMTIQNFPREMLAKSAYLVLEAWSYYAQAIRACWLSAGVIAMNIEETQKAYKADDKRKLQGCRWRCRDAGKRCREIKEIKEVTPRRELIPGCCYCWTMGQEQVHPAQRSQNRTEMVLKHLLVDRPWLQQWQKPHIDAETRPL